MPIIEIDKQGGYIVITTDGKVLKRSILYEDTVVSVPPLGYKKVKNTYYDPVTKLVVIEVDPDS